MINQRFRHRGTEACRATDDNRRRPGEIEGIQMHGGADSLMYAMYPMLARANENVAKRTEAVMSYKRTGLLLRLSGAFLIVGLATAQTRPPSVQSLRMYVMDCGLLTRGDPMLRFGVTTAQVGGVTDFVTPCFLIAHPKGSILWDTGIVADRLVKPDGNTTVVSNTPLLNWTAMQTYREAADTIGPSIVYRSLKSQLQEIGHTSADITYLVLSHNHVDHTANANDYAASTWIVQKAERDFMFSERQRASSNFSSYSALEKAKTVVLEGDHDVFGDGNVVIKSTPGHSPGHQSLFLKLARTGPVFVTGDLYHYEAERTLGVIPPPSPDKERERVSRATIEVFLKQTGAQLWVQHSLPNFRKLKKSPAYYD